MCILLPLNHCQSHLHDLVAIQRVIPSRSNVSPNGLGREEQQMFESQIVHHISPDKGLVVALGEVGDRVGGVWLIVHTLQVEV